MKALQSFHIRITKESNRAIVLTDDYLSKELAVLNAEFLNRDQSWVLIKPVGSELYFGPLFLPGRTGCWECLAHRLRLHKNGEDPTSRASTSATLNAAWNLAAIKIARWIANQELPELEGKIITLDLLSGETASHTLVWRPQCPACSDALFEGGRDIQPVVLRSTKKNFLLDGGHRVTDPEGTLEKYQHHVSPITGIVGKLNPYGVSKASAVHVYSGSVRNPGPHESLKSIDRVMTFSGKGATDIQARTSALCESLERFSGMFHGNEPRRKARFKDFGEAAIHPYTFMHYSEKQYSNRETWNSKNDPKMFVPKQFDEQDEMEWSPIWSLSHKTMRFIPTSFCYYNDPARLPTICHAHSNGNAAGNTLEEAILQGFLELIERDSVAIWWYNRIQRPGVDWRSFGIPYLEEVRKYHLHLNREIWVLDISSDLEVPAFAALSRFIDGTPERIIMGFGSHLDARIALLRAMTELNQAIAWTDQNQPFPAEFYKSLQSDVSLDSVTAGDLPHAFPDSTKKLLDAGNYPQLWTEDLKEDIHLLQRKVESKRMEVLVLDQTRPDIGLPVVKVIVPELRHFWPRFAPGRLYDVPVQLGWRSQSLSEDELNPIMIFV